MAYFKTNVLDNQIKALPTIATASGAVANFTTDKAENLVECVCEVESGSSEINVVACGKNLFNKSTTISNEYITNTGTPMYSGSGSHSDFIAIKTGIPYYFSHIVGIGAFYSIAIYDSSKNFIKVENLNGAGDTSGSVTFTEGSYIIVNLLYSNNDICQIEIGNTATTYEPYNSTTYNIQLGETLTDTAIYNAVTGVLTRNDTTTKQLDSCPIVTIANSENNIWSDTGDIEVKFVLSVGSYVNQNV